MEQPITLNLKVAGARPETLQVLFGGDMLFGKPPTHSVAMDRIVTISGAPQHPVMPRLDQPWWRVLARRRVIREREVLVSRWEKDYAAWVADGKPDREVLIRTYIPNARIEIQEA